MPAAAQLLIAMVDEPGRIMGGPPLMPASPVRGAIFAAVPARGPGTLNP